MLRKIIPLIFSLILILSTFVTIDACISYSFLHPTSADEGEVQAEVVDSDNQSESNDNNPLSSIVSGVMLSPLYKSVRVMNTFANNIEGTNYSDINDGNTNGFSSESPEATLD